MLINGLSVEICVYWVQTSANEKTRFSFVCSFVNKRQTNANEKTKKTKYTNDKQTKKTLFSVCLNFLKLIFLKKISVSLRFMIKKVILLTSDAY